MQIEPAASASASPLRLVQPTPSVRPVQPVQPVDAVKRSPGESDPLSFEAVYQTTLPKAAVGEALERLDRIRAQLVAARTSVPIHFDTPQPAAAMRSSSVARAYLRSGPAPADLNASATSAAAALDESA